jgi:probable rRNA maturation factor
MQGSGRSGDRLEAPDGACPEDDAEPPDCWGRPAEVEVILEVAGWRRLVPQATTLARRAALAALRQEGAAGALTVLLTDDRALKRLNGEHRGKDKPTNVLSFPAESADAFGPDGDAGSPAYLGDIALALGVVRREARAAGRSPAAHLAHLVAHGTLHLLGHDHLEAGEARRMERAEARIMGRLRLPNPWKEGAGRIQP